MAAQRTERLLNLVICLLAARRFVSKEKIRDAVPQYAESESDEAFERMFERDKDDLREMGIPLDTGSNDAFFEDEIGYRIPRDEYALPEVTFDPAELAVLGLAARAWQQATFAAAATTAVRKLAASGVDVDPEALAVVEPRVGADEPAFALLYTAVRDRRPVQFSYSGATTLQPEPREVEPWGMVSWHGHWYLVGHDTNRGATRVFRLSRITGDIVHAGAVGSVQPPPEVDLRAEVQMLAPVPHPAIARISVRNGSALPLRRRGTPTKASANPGWTEFDVPHADVEQLAAEVCGFGADVVAVSPPDLIHSVVARLTAAARIGRLA